MQFLEASNTVEIRREAGPAGLHVKEIAKKISALRSWKTEEPLVELDSSKLSVYLEFIMCNATSN